MLMNCILCSSGYNTFFVFVFLTLHTISLIVVAVTELASLQPKHHVAYNARVLPPWNMSEICRVIPVGFRDSLM